MRWVRETPSCWTLGAYSLIRSAGLWQLLVTRERRTRVVSETPAEELPSANEFKSGRKWAEGLMCGV